jgi:hypothetical protein
MDIDLDGALSLTTTQWVSQLKVVNERERGKERERERTKKKKT